MAGWEEDTWPLTFQMFQGWSCGSPKKFDVWYSGTKAKADDHMFRFPWTVMVYVGVIVN